MRSCNDTLPLPHLGLGRATARQLHWQLQPSLLRCCLQMQVAILCQAAGERSGHVILCKAAVESAHAWVVLIRPDCSMHMCGHARRTRHGTSAPHCRHPSTSHRHTHSAPCLLLVHPEAIPHCRSYSGLFRSRSCHPHGAQPPHQLLALLAACSWLCLLAPAHMRAPKLSHPQAPLLHPQLLPPVDGAPQVPRLVAVPGRVAQVAQVAAACARRPVRHGIMGAMVS